MSTPQTVRSHRARAAAASADALAPERTHRAAAPSPQFIVDLTPDYAIYQHQDKQRYKQHQRQSQQHHQRTEAQTTRSSKPNSTPSPILPHPACNRAAEPQSTYTHIVYDHPARLIRGIVIVRGGLGGPRRCTFRLVWEACGYAEGWIWEHRCRGC